MCFRDTAQICEGSFSKPTFKIIRTHLAKWYTFNDSTDLVHIMGLWIPRETAVAFVLKKNVHMKRAGSRYCGIGLDTRHKVCTLWLVRYFWFWQIVFEGPPPWPDPCCYFSSTSTNPKTDPVSYIFRNSWHEVLFFTDFSDHTQG